jgi:hypothetical protein
MDLGIDSWVGGCGTAEEREGDCFGAGTAENWRRGAEGKESNWLLTKQMAELIKIEPKEVNVDAE